jgi:cellulose synthase/poly-beta-1,6-N-acetylglucosamine synthase-like glycosyltransferase
VTMTAVWMMLSTLSTISAVIITGFAVHRLWLCVGLGLVRAPRPQTGPAPQPPNAPMVTVQIPLFNEPLVAARAIHAATQLAWPMDRLQIQVCDDSTDHTCAVVDDAVRAAQHRGVHIEVLRRSHRQGFKAGALRAAMASARGTFVAIIDADFVLPSDFLLRMIPSFHDDKVGMVQARWGHLNADASWLTAVQAVWLDAHFAVEHACRAAHGRFFNFNGTAGIWRAQCIHDAGGWHGDTLSEDVDLSYRAQQLGWRFVYRDDVVVPAELPNTWHAWMAQQRRWCVGLWQVAHKLLPSLWSSKLAMSVRLEASAHLLSPVASVATAWLLPSAALLLQHNGFHVDWRWWLWGAACSTCMTTFFVLGQVRVQAARTRLLKLLWLLPMAMTAGLLLSLTNTMGLLRNHWRALSFERTPKQGHAVSH